MGLSNTDLSGWDLTGLDLSGSDFSDATLVGTHFGGSDLRYVEFRGAKLNHSDFSEANLTGVGLSDAVLANSDLSDAIIVGAGFSGTTRLGFTREQFYSTASYRDRDLKGINLGENDLDNTLGNWYLNNLRMKAALDFSGYTNKAVWGKGMHSKMAKNDF